MARNEQRRNIDFLASCIKFDTLRNGKNIRTAIRKRISDINSISRPNWESVPIEEYIDNALTHGANLGRCMPILASRGCPYYCTFCSSPQIFLISDNGCQPTSQRFMMNCSLLGIKQIFTTWCNPKGNSDTERVMRTIKEDILTKWIHNYNEDFPHQSLNNMTPKQFFESIINELVPT